MTDNTQPEALRLADWLDGCGGLTSKSAAAELRRQHALIAELNDRVAKGFDAADMATASAQGFRDGAASVAATAGSEPVALGAWDNLKQMMMWSAFGGVLQLDDALANIDEFAGLHPSPQEGMVGVWIDLPGTLPEPGTPVLLDIGKEYPIRAMWAAKHTVEAADDDTDWAEYDEATETYYCPEGWYEWNEHEEIHWAVRTTPCAWAPLPPTTPAGSGKGE